MKTPRSKQPAKRSPITEKQQGPRIPGGSLQDRYINTVFVRVAPWVFFPLTAWGLAGQAWIHEWFESDPSPWTITIIAAVLTALAFWRYPIGVRETERILDGIRGERSVAGHLDELRSDGYRIFHDIECKGVDGAFNIDHLVIGERGVFVIETKTVSKRTNHRGEARIQVVSDNILIDGSQTNHDPRAQSSATAAFVRDWIRRSFGISVPVRPVVVYPGWYVLSHQPLERHAVWVFNPEMLVSALRRVNAEPVIEQRTVNQIVSALNKREPLS